MITVSLSELGANIPTLTNAAGAMMREGCTICFDDLGHASGTIIHVGGIVDRKFSLVWEDEVTDVMRRAWRNRSIATEWAAHGIALLLIKELTDYTALERQRRKSGFHYWLGNTDAKVTFLDRKAGLVVAGLRRASKGQVASRVRQEHETKIRIDGDYPRYVAVVELSRPSMYIDLDRKVMK